MEKSKFVKEQLAIKEQVEKELGTKIKVCDKCNGIEDWKVIPVNLHRHFDICICIKCECGEKDFDGSKTIILKYNEDGDCLGYCCSKCNKENVTELKQLELIMLSKDQEDVV